MSYIIISSADIQVTTQDEDGNSVTSTVSKTSAERCEMISEALWTIQRPRSVRQAGDTTTKFATVVTHSDGRAALKMDASRQIRPHADLDTTELYDSMPEYTTQKKTAVTNKLASNHGVNIDVGDILPTSFSYTDQSTMEADGWFPDPGL